MKDERKNMRIRKALLLAGMNQGDLSKVIGYSEQFISTLMKNFELAKSEQDEIIRKIKEAE